MYTKCKNNVDFFWKNVEKNQRLDGRALFDSRNISIYFLREYGHSIITIGNTKVVCMITGEIVEPLEKKPNEGIVRIHLDTDSFNHIIDNSKTNEECIEIRNIIDRTLKSSKTLNFESLCIIPYKKVWCLYINLTVIEHDGNIFDACFLAAYSSLVHFRKTEIKIDEDFSDNEILNICDMETLSLSVHNIPVLSTFAYFEKYDTFMIDPALYEQELMTSHFSVAVNKNGKLINVLKSGGSPIDYSKISELIEIAKQRVPAVLKILQDAIDEDRNVRNCVKTSNLHVQYSCNPVPIIYNENVEEGIIDFKKCIPIDQTIVLEKLFDAYENAEGGDGGEGRDEFDQGMSEGHSTIDSEEETDGVCFEHTKHRRKGGKSRKKKTEEEGLDYDRNYNLHADDGIKLTQNMMQAMLESAKRAIKEKDNVTNNVDIIRKEMETNDNEKENIQIKIENFTNVSHKKTENFDSFSMLGEKEHREMLRIKRQEMADGGKLPTNKYLKTEKIDRLGKWESESQVGGKRSLDNILEQHGEIGMKYINTNKKVVNSCNSYREDPTDVKKKKNDNTLLVSTKKDEESSSDVDFSVAINENLTPIKKKEKQKVKKEKKK